MGEPPWRMYAFDGEFMICLFEMHIRTKEKQAKVSYEVHSHHFTFNTKNISRKDINISEAFMYKQMP